MSPQPAPQPGAPARPRKPQTSLQVLRTEWLSAHMVRVYAGGREFEAFADRYAAKDATDQYVKIWFVDPALGVPLPVDAAALKDAMTTQGRIEHLPVTRTYTVRRVDRAAGELAIDFVVHGDEGLAGPWAARAEAGQRIGFFGPGGAYAPDATADRQLLVGDEAAIPAICATLDRLGEDARALVYLEVDGPDSEQHISASPQVDVVWVHRAGRLYGDALAEVVRKRGVPSGDVQAFVHGNAEMIRQLRRYLFSELDFNRSRVSMSGYWSTGQTEDGWQASKREFNASLERADGVVAA